MAAKTVNQPVRMGFKFDRASLELPLIGFLLFLLTIYILRLQLFAGKALYWGDIGLYFTPMLEFDRANLRAGHTPLWNPLILCGTPFAGNPQAWPLYPSTLILPFVNVSTFLNLSIAFHVWIAAIGTYLFSRRVSLLPVLPSIFTAMIFAFGGQLLSKEQFPNMVQAAAYLPWLLYWTKRLVDSPTSRSAVWLGSVLGLQLLSAHAQITFLSLYLSFAYGVFRLRVTGQANAAAIKRLAIPIAICLVIALGLSAGQWVPGAELFEYSARQKLGFRLIDRFYLPFSQLLNFVLPNLHGNPSAGNFSARGNYWETCCFVGTVPFLFFIAGFVQSWKKLDSQHIDSRFWCLVVVLGLLFAIGGQNISGQPIKSGLYAIAYFILPGFSSFHDPARFLLWVCWGMACLSGYGLDRAIAATRNTNIRRYAAVLVLLLTYLDLSSFDSHLYPLADQSSLHPKTNVIKCIANDAEVRQGQARYLAPDTARVWQRFTAYRSYRAEIQNYQELWADTLIPNLAAPYDLLGAFGYEPFTRKDCQRLTGAVNDSFHSDAAAIQQSQASKLAGMLAVRYVSLLRNGLSGKELPGMQTVLQVPSLGPVRRPKDIGSTYLLMNRNWQPRAKLMTSFITVPSSDAAWTLIHDGIDGKTKSPVDLSRTAVVSESIPLKTAEPTITKAEIMDSNPDNVRVKAIVSKPSLLVVADTMHPGWHAAVDDKATSIVPVDVFLRGIVISSPGTHIVQFNYVPTSYLFGLYITMVSILTICAASVLGAFSRHIRAIRAGI